MSAKISTIDYAFAKLAGKRGPLQGITIHSHFGVEMVGGTALATLARPSMTWGARKMTGKKQAEAETYVRDAIRDTLLEMETNGQYNKSFFCETELNQLVENYTDVLGRRIAKSGMNTATLKTADPGHEYLCECTPRPVDAESLREKCMGIMTRRYGLMGVFCDSRYQEVREPDVSPTAVLRTCEFSKHDDQGIRPIGRWKY
jgi:hypothetical protein